MNHFTSTEESLPNNSQRVIIITKGRHVCEGIYVKDINQFIITCSVLNPNEILRWYPKEQFLIEAI